MTNLKKNVLITGATGGIGEIIAKSFHENGYNVILSGTRQEKLDEIKNSLVSNAHAYACSLTDRESVTQLIPNIEKDHGPIDLLINNAGITKDALSIFMKDNQWDDVIQINLSSVFFLSKVALKSMMKRKSGKIINITSIVGFTGNPGQSNYCASKAGIVGMTKSLAHEVATRGITINCVAPGFIKTAMTDVLKDSIKEKILSNIPMNKMGSGEDIASACLYLASDGANYVTGQTIHVNGGMYM